MGTGSHEAELIDDMDQKYFLFIHFMGKNLNNINRLLAI